MTKEKGNIIHAEPTLADMYHDKLVQLYRNEKEKSGQPCGEIRVQYTTEFDYNVFHTFYQRGKESRSNKFRVTSIELVERNRSTFHFYVKLSENKGEDLKVDDMTGVFRIGFSDGTFMYIAKWVANEGKMRMVDSMYAAEDSVWVNFIKLSRQIDKVRMKPPVGAIYKVVGTKGSGKNAYNEYEAKEKIKETPVIHPSVSKVVDDMDMFFGNLDKFTRWNMPGTRKVMIVGPPGTGKTSLTLRLANKYMKTKNVTFFTDIESLGVHLVMCAKYKISTMCVIEDAESSLQHVNSSLLNFLDGIDQPINPAGAYIIMTTNHPQRIEPRILQRPGRVDAIFAFGNLTDEYVMKCAEFYLGDLFFGKDRLVKDSVSNIRKELEDMFDAKGNGITGTRIKQFSEDILRYMISKKQDTITMKEARVVFENTAHDMKNVYKMVEELGLLGGDKVGFDFGERNSREQEEYSDSNMM